MLATKFWFINLIKRTVVKVKPEPYITILVKAPAFSNKEVTCSIKDGAVKLSSIVNNEGYAVFEPTVLGPTVIDILDDDGNILASANVEVASGHMKNYYQKYKVTITE